MNLLRFENDRYIFYLAKQERELLALILRLYPVIPSAHQPLSKTAANANLANQHLLNEALAEQRNENKKLVQSFLADPERFRETETSCQLTLTAAEIEWLLQVLNDVHVGSWIQLGSPEDRVPLVAPEDPNARHVLAMDLAGFFQTHLLQAVNEKP